MLRGVNALSDAVETTLGPKGRNVIIDQPYGAPKITKDGVTVAKSIEFEDRFENMGAQLVRQVANKANEAAGDGTTTATVLARAIYAEGCKSVAAGLNPMDLRRGVNMAVDAVVEELRKMTKNVSSNEEIMQVATISANNDQTIGKLIATAMEKVGKDGVITVQDGKTLSDELEVVEGMKFDRGFISPYFMTDTKTMKTEMEDPAILLYDSKISTVQSLLPILENIAREGRSLVIIAEDVDGEALSTLILNKLRGGLKVCAVKAPGFGDNRKNTLADLAVLTGATLISQETGQKLESATMDMLGSAKKITITKDDTVILNGQGAPEAIAARCENIRSLISTTQSTYEKEKLEERLAKLSGGVAVIKVGGASEVEVGEKKDRIEDALNATRAAVEEGIVAGGGTAYVNAVPAVEKLIGKVEGDEKTGVKIIVNALQEPVRQIAKNAGVDGSVVLEKIKSSRKVGYGFDAYKEVYCDMIGAGIVDPAKVTRSALENAASVSSMVLTTEALVADKPEPPAPAAPAGMGGMDGMY